MESNSNIPDNNPGMKILLIVVVLLVVGAVAYLFTTGKGGDVGGDDNGISGFLSSFPIWIAIFIPIMASKKKKREIEKKRMLDPMANSITTSKTEKEQKDIELRRNILLIWVFLVGSVVFGVVIYIMLMI